MSMIKKYIVVPALILVFLGPVLKAQEQPGLRERADKLYLTYNYAQASSIYSKLADVKKPKLKDLERLADCYWKMNDYEAAENWYARVVQFPQSSPQNLLLYAEVLKSNARYEQAKSIFKQYASKSGDVKRVTNDIAGCDSAVVWMAKPTNHHIKNESLINTANSEFGVSSIGKQLFYVAEPNAAAFKKIYGRTGNPYLRIYTASQSPDSGLAKPEINQASYNNGRYHIGPVVSNKAGNVLYVTRTYPGQETELTREHQLKFGTHNLELFIYSNLNGQWEEIAFPYNNVQKYSVGHAALSKDEKTLYFVSDMPGGFGGTDIWYSERKSDGTWGQPQNAGGRINTPGNEMFPNLNEDGVLYYSSNGLPGMGGLDIFSAKGSQNNWSVPLNLKYPINSSGDDFAFLTAETTAGTKSGYLSSNRKGGKGGDDIYSFNSVISKIILALKGTVVNKKTGEILPASAVTLFQNGRQLVAKQNSSSNGTFFFELEKDVDYSVLGQKEKFYGDSVQLSTKGLIKSDTLNVVLRLDPLFEIGKAIALKDIHYNFDKDNIRPDAAKILDELVRTMRDNPTLEIELGSHTDSRGADVYNLDLSQRRARSVVNYLVSRGIDRGRMKAKGYGETKLLNRCSNGVKCSEAEHQTNRRTEFKILKL
ncbi:OmpA family protein [Pedobacter nutrimenti]|uniref:WD40 repeat protein n=1 Tax=Pedobacter nutrimenti TaxID=1241337 RepID=A0A318UM28_9SPHI|nr:OmpA family protein [Pedobacter nutrimenti]PYF77452.1 WD40 repeat protein [Pedobacter nutrimenti]